MSRAYVIALAVVATMLAACAPRVAMQSSAPPGRVARLDEVRGFWGLQHYKVEVTEGIALAMSCYDSENCKGLTIKPDDPKVVDIRKGSFGALEQSAWGPANHLTSAAFVLVGKARGTTKLLLRTSEGSREIRVTVVPAPTPSPPATVAR